MSVGGGTGGSDRHRLSTASQLARPSSPCPVEVYRRISRTPHPPCRGPPRMGGATARQARAVRSGSRKIPRPFPPTRLRALPSSTRRHPPPVSNAPAERVGGTFPRSRSSSMPQHPSRPPGGNSNPRPGCRDVYGPGYRRARAAAFKRSKGLCQLCGRRPAVEAHHYALKYPDAGAVTADDLTPLCRLCHWIGTFRRALDRVFGAGTWVILAAGTRPAAGRRPALRH